MKEKNIDRSISRYSRFFLTIRYTTGANFFA